MTPYPGSLHPVEGKPGAFNFALTPDHPAFAGHFPGRPILPGVIQVDWAVRLGQDTFGPLGAFRAIEHLKFQATIEPGELIQLELDWDQVTHQLTFAYAGSQGRKSSAVILFD